MADHTIHTPKKRGRQERKGSTGDEMVKAADAALEAREKKARRKAADDKRRKRRRSVNEV